MVVRYIKVTFVTIFVLVVGLISTVNIKGAEPSGNGINDLGLIWHTQTDAVYGVSQYTQITTNSDYWANGNTGEITNNDDPMTIIVIDNQSNIIKEMILEPNTYIIENEIIDENAKVLRIYTGYLSYDNLRYNISYSANDYLSIEFRYYTSGIFKDYYDLGYDKAYNDGDYMDYYWDGFEIGQRQGISSAYYGGFASLIDSNTNSGYIDQYSYSYKNGFRDGAVSNTDFSFTGLLTQIFVGIGSILGIELLPNITIGAIVAIPIVFGIIYFILGKRSKD